MASVNVLFVFVGAFLVIAGAGSSDDCQEMILGCTSRVLGNAAANLSSTTGQQGPGPIFCRKLDESLQCLTKNGLSCDVRKMNRELNQMGMKCHNRPPGCYVADYKSCGNRISIQGVDDCLAYDCINNLRHNCRGRGFDDFYDGARRDYDRMKQKCGCSNLQPCVLMVLTTLVLLALPSWVNEKWEKVVATSGGLLEEVVATSGGLLEEVVATSVGLLEEVVATSVGLLEEVVAMAGGLLGEVVATSGGLLEEVVTTSGGLLEEVVATSGGLLEEVIATSGGLLEEVVAMAVGNFQLFVSKQALNYWDEDSSVIGCFLWDFALICLFIVQHSVMASPWFKNHLQSWLRVSVSERLLYLCMTCACLMVMMLYWYSIPEVYLWYIDTKDTTFLWTFFLLCHFVGWLFIGLEVLLMDVGELLGFTQVQNYYNGLTPPHVKKKLAQLCSLYSRMRHPGVVILSVLLWFHPLMTLDRVLLASLFTTYMVWRHQLDDVHYEYAEKHFYLTSSSSKRKSRHTVTYECFDH